MLGFEVDQSLSASKVSAVSRNLIAAMPVFGEVAALSVAAIADRFTPVVASASTQRVTVAFGIESDTSAQGDCSASVNGTVAVVVYSDETVLSI